MGERLKILFIEDDPDIAFIMEQALRRDPDIEARHAGCGSDAIRLLRDEQWKPDCILVDYKLPDVTGATVLAQIRDLPDFYDVPSIFITANPTATIGARSALGSLGTISKPFSIVTLVDEVRALLPAPSTN